MNEYLLEYMGALVICYALLFTNENPLIVGLSHSAVLYLAKSSELHGHFTPISVINGLLLKRIPVLEGLKLMGIHILAAISVVMLYSGTLT
jgi:hypothetical protein